MDYFVCYNKTMRRFKQTSKSSSRNTSKKVDKIFLQKTIKDDFGNKNTVILKWGDGQGNFLKQEIKNNGN